MYKAHYSIHTQDISLGPEGNQDHSSCSTAIIVHGRCHNTCSVALIHVLWLGDTAIRSRRFRGNKPQGRSGLRGRKPHHGCAVLLGILTVAKGERNYHLVVVLKWHTNYQTNHGNCTTQNPIQHHMICT